MRPSRILLCILSTFIVLGAVSVLFAGKSSVVRVPSLASVLGFPAEASEPSESSEFSESSESSELSEPSAPADTVAKPDTIPVKPKQVELPAALPQTKLALPAFYAALEKAGKQSVRIVHFGDSQINPSYDITELHSIPI